MHNPIPELLEQAADELIHEKPHWREDGCSHMLDLGVCIVQCGTVQPLDSIREGRYRVGSHLVNMAVFNCPCSEFDCQGMCRHIMAVLVYDRAQLMRAEFEREYEAWDVKLLVNAATEGGNP